MITAAAAPRTAPTPNPDTTPSPSPVPVPPNPAAPAELVRLADEHMVRLDYTEPEVATWREGGFLGLGGTKFTSERQVGYSHEFSGRVFRNELPKLEYASTTFDGAVAAAQRQAVDVNRFDGTRREHYAVAVLQAQDGAYFTTLIPTISGWINRPKGTWVDEFVGVGPARPVPAINVRPLTPWSAPVGSDPDAVSRSPRRDDEPVKWERTGRTRLAGGVRYTDAIKAVIDVVGSFDLRTTDVVPRPAG